MTTECKDTLFAVFGVEGLIEDILVRLETGWAMSGLGDELRSLDIGCGDVKAAINKFWAIYLLT